MPKFVVPSLLTVSFVSACAAVGPDYSKPDISVSENYFSGGSEIGDVSKDTWWERLNDEKLNELIDRALAANLDLATANNRIKAAEIALRQTGIIGQISGRIDAQVQRSGGDVIPAGTNDSQTFSAGYVLDLFGGARRGTERAQANLEAAELDAGTTRIALIAGVASTYIDARYYQEALALTRQNIESRRKTLSLIEGQREIGTVSELDVAQTRAQLDTAISNLPALEAAFEAQVFALATLLSEPAAPLMKMMNAGAPQPLPTMDQEAGVPADLLRNRPDVMAAERRLAASVAAVGVAQAQLYPSVSLQGTIIEGASGTWSFGPSLSIPILNQGGLRAQRDSAATAAEAAEIAWRKTVLKAVEDVQSSQNAFKQKRKEISALKDVRASTETVLNLSRNSFEFGDLSMLDLLEAERAADASKMTMAAAVRNAAKAWSALMVATGRGWSSEAN